MKNIETRKFIKKLEKNGYVLIHIRGSHATYKNRKGRLLVIPVSNREINGCIVRRLVKEYELVND